MEGDAHRVLYDFLKYSELYPEKMANAMHYDVDGFKSRIKRLAKAYDAANCGEANQDE